MEAGLWILAKSIEAVIGLEDFFSSLNHAFIFDLLPVFTKNKLFAILFGRRKARGSIA